MAAPKLGLRALRGFAVWRAGCRCSLPVLFRDRHEVILQVVVEVGPFGDESSGLAHCDGCFVLLEAVPRLALPLLWVGALGDDLRAVVIQG